MAKTRVGIVGLGNIGATHARVVTTIDDAEVVAVSGGTAERLSELGLSSVEHLKPEQVITHPDVDVVALTSPSAVHAEQALAALDAGKHVVIEKPIALSAADADAVVARATARGLVISAIAQRRLEPQHVYLKQRLDAGDLGTPVLGETFVHWYRDDAYYAHAAWRTSQAEGGGSLMNQGVHNVDLLNWLFGPAEEVSAHYATIGHRHDAEDTTVATVKFASGALGIIATSTATAPGHPAKLALFTSKGAAEFSLSEVVRWEFDGVEPPAAAGPATSGAADPLAIGDAGHEAQWRDVLAAIRDGREPMVTGEDGAAVVRLMCAIYQAAESGRTIRVQEMTA